MQRRVKIDRALEKKGFSLIEVLVVLGILLIIITTVISVSAFSVKLGRSSSQRVIAAAYLQEGMEAVRNVRDTNLKNGATFSSGIPMDPKNVSISISGGSVALGEITGKQTLNDGFERKVNVTSNANEMTVVCEVFWDNGGNSIKAISKLANWKN